MPILGARRWTVISIWEPRYHDKVVLIKTDRVGQRNKIIIERGAYAGEYFAAGIMIKDCPIKPMTTKNGRKVNMYHVPLSQLERI